MEYYKKDGLGRGKGKNNGILHEVIIYEGSVSLEVQKSHDNKCNLFESIEFDDISNKKIAEVIKNFIM